MKSVFEINDYREACKFLQKKYDKKGFVRKDYYHVDPKDGHLIKTSGVRFITCFCACFTA